MPREASIKLAVLRFGWFSSDEKIAKYAQILTQVLQEKNIRTKGSLLYMGYNAPWDVINRRNEVVFQIDWMVTYFFALYEKGSIVSYFIQLVSFPVWLRVEGMLFFFSSVIVSLKTKNPIITGKTLL